MHACTSASMSFQVQGDVLSSVLEFLPNSDLTSTSLVASGWSADPQSTRRLHLGYLADRLVENIRGTQHDHKQHKALSPSSPAIVVEEQMNPHLFNLLFGRNASMSEEGSLEVKFSKPREVINALPSLPIAVDKVKNNAPPLLDGPLTCWAGYMDGSVKYDGSKLTLLVRSRIVKLSPGWQKSMEKLRIHEYLDDAPSERTRAASI